MQISYEQKKGENCCWNRIQVQREAKTSPNSHRNAQTAPNDLDTIKPLTEPQIAKYSMILCKLGSISDLSNFPTIQPL